MAPSRSRSARYARRRRKRMARVEHDLADDQWAALRDAWGGCAYCGGEGALQRDCVLAISRGGRYTLDNVVLACRSCNASTVPNGEGPSMHRRVGGVIRPARRGDVLSARGLGATTR